MAFLLRSAKGKPDKETGEAMPREIFMNKSMFDAPENAIAEACIMYVAQTRAKYQTVQLWFEKSGEEEVVIDPTRCVECNALTDPDDHAVCIECNGLLCNEYKPLRGSQGGLLHKGGEFDTTLSCGEFLPKSADDFFDFTSTERLEKTKHERYCDSCYDNAPRDSYVSEECNIQNGSEQYIQGEQNFDRRTAGHRCDREIWDKLSLEMRGLRMQIQEHLREAHWNWRYYPLHNGTHPYDVAMARVESLLGAYENCLDWIDETADQEVSKPRDSNDIRHELEQAGILPANGATRVCCNCEKQAVFDVDTAIGTRSFCSEKCYAEYNGLEVMEDPNFYGMMLITRDSADFCNTCDAHIDLAGRDMLPHGMCIDCYITERLSLIHI